MAARRSPRYGPSLLVLGTALLVLAAGPLLVRRVGDARQAARVAQARARLDATASELRLLDAAIRDVAIAVEPCVVHITVDRPGEGIFDPTSRYNGSGWIYDADGHVITNHHVVNGAERIEVRLHDGTPVPAELIGTDQKTDIAVLRIDPRPGLIPAVRATGADVSQGDMVFAFGSPFGFEFSMSSGIVSGKGRRATLTLTDRYENLIQTDAAINPGNSGGPLTNIAGEVVGMNTAIAVDPTAASRAVAFAGVGLAIPLSMIEYVVPQLIETGRVLRGGLGLSFDELTATARNRIGYEGPGIAVAELLDGSPAREAGLRIGDVIRAIDDEPILHGQIFRSIVASTPAGSRLELSVWRDGETREIEVVLGELESITHEPLVRLGIEALDLLEARTRDLYAQPQVRGVYVRDVVPGSPADRAGLSGGWVIHRAAGRMVDGVLDLALLVSATARPFRIGDRAPGGDYAEVVVPASD